jgi:hypothetical protein
LVMLPVMIVSFSLLFCIILVSKSNKIASKNKKGN